MFLLEEQPIYFFLFILISSVVLLAIFYIIPRLILINTLSKKISKIADVYGSKKLLLSEQGIVIAFHGNAKRIHFKEINAINLKYGFIDLGFVEGDGLIIPVKVFSNQENVNEFVKTIKSKIKKI